MSCGSGGFLLFTMRGSSSATTVIPASHHKYTAPAVPPVPYVNQHATTAAEGLGGVSSSTISHPTLFFTLHLIHHHH